MAKKNEVTVVFTQNFHTDERKSYEFKRIKTNNPHDLYNLREELIKDFDNAEVLCAFNVYGLTFLFCTEL